MVGVSSSSAKMYVWGLEVALAMMLAMSLGEVGELELARWMKGWRASRALVCI